MLASTGRPAVAGPVKHWAALPGREIRTVALRGAMSSESVLDVVPGIDGWIYVRGKNAVYRLLGTEGAFAPVASFDWCDDRQARAVVPYATPAFACVAKNFIVEMKGTTQYRRVLPRPDWSGASDVYNGDYPFVTSIDRAASGRWWFAYGYASGLGYSDPDGRTRLAQVHGLPPIRGVARLGDDLFVAADGCVLARVRDFVVRGTEHPCTSPMAPQIVRTADALWVLTEFDVERRDVTGAVRRWHFGDRVNSVAYDRVSHTAYFLGGGYAERNVLIAIGRDGVAHTTRLPMTGGTSIAVDGRGRIWISVPNSHALAAIAPDGAWG
jgi:hypothetical protein